MVLANLFSAIEFYWPQFFQIKYLFANNKNDAFSDTLFREFLQRKRLILVNNFRNKSGLQSSIIFYVWAFVFPSSSEKVFPKFNAFTVYYI